MLLLFANLIIIFVFSNVKMEQTFYNALNVSSLAIAFVSFIASSFFSFSVYMQTKNQNKINESLPKKDDQYIIANYSLFNIENEISGIFGSLFTLMLTKVIVTLATVKATENLGREHSRYFTLLYCTMESGNIKSC